MALLGTFEGRVDPQGRVVVPQKFRDPVEQSMVLARGMDGCIEVYPPLEWEAVSERVKLYSPMDPVARLYRRLTFSRAYAATMDRQGRVLLPAPLRQYADITEEVVMAGQDSYFEIWAPERWETQESQETRMSEIAELLERQAREKGNAQSR